MNLHTVLSRQSAKRLCLDLRKGGKIIVFTNGCFDLIHEGHLRYLEKAKSFGDVLIVAVNSDQSIKRIKGEKRPLVNERQRAKIIASLYCVDYSVIFNEDNPIKLISELKPDIHVKGGDYKKERLPEYSTVISYGGSVKILPYIKGVSTTNLIDKILNVYGKKS